MSGIAPITIASLRPSSELLATHKARPRLLIRLSPPTNLKRFIAAAQICAQTNMGWSPHHVNRSECVAGLGDAGWLGIRKVNPCIKTVMAFLNQRPTWWRNWNRR